jgi:hypothetical protein
VRYYRTRSGDARHASVRGGATGLAQSIFWRGRSAASGSQRRRDTESNHERNHRMRSTWRFPRGCARRRLQAFSLTLTNREGNARHRRHCRARVLRSHYGAQLHDDAGRLSPGEAVLFGELLDRLSGPRDTCGIAPVRIRRVGRAEARPRFSELIPVGLLPTSTGASESRSDRPGSWWSCRP